MADEIIIVDNSSSSADSQLASLGLKRSAAFAKLEAKKSASALSKTDRKTKARAVQDGKIAALSTRKYCPFVYADKDKGITFVYMTGKTAVKCGIKLLEQAFANVTKDGKLKGLQSIGLMKCKKIRVSYGLSFVDRQKATSGTKTGRTGRSRSISKSLVRRWTTINVPLDAKNVDILAWIEGTWKKKPQLLEVGSQVFPIRNKDTASSNRQ